MFTYTPLIEGAPTHLLSQWVDWFAAEDFGLLDDSAPKEGGRAGACSDSPGRDRVLLLPYLCRAELQFYLFCFHQQLPEISQLYHLLLVLLSPLKLIAQNMSLVDKEWQTDVLDWFLTPCFSLARWKSTSILQPVLMVPSPYGTFFVVTLLSVSTSRSAWLLFSIC